MLIIFELAIGFKCTESNRNLFARAAGCAEGKVVLVRFSVQGGAWVAVIPAMANRVKFVDSSEGIQK